MGGNNRQKKSSSSFSVFSLFKSKGSQKVKYTNDESPNMQKVWPSGGVRWITEPPIDKEASAFIEKFHEKRSRIAAAN